MIINIIIFVAGFIVGALVARKNLDEVNKVVEEAKELAAKAQEELAELKDSELWKTGSEVRKLRP